VTAEEREASVAPAVGGVKRAVAAGRGPASLGLPAALGSLIKTVDEASVVVEDFVRGPEILDVQIAPDGTKVAARRHSEAGERIVVRDLVTQETRQFESWKKGDMDDLRPTNGIAQFRWLTPRRLLLTTEASVQTDRSYLDAYRTEVEATIAQRYGDYVAQMVNRNAPTGNILSEDEYRTQFLVNNRALIFHNESMLRGRLTRSGYVAIDLDGSNRIELPGMSRTDAAYPPADSVVRLVWDAQTLRVSRGRPDSILLSGTDDAWTDHPNLLRLDTSGGGFKREEENPGRINEWLLDWDERARLGVERLPATTKLFHRPDPAGSKWSELADLGVPQEQLVLHRFDPTGAVLYASRPEPGANWALYGYTLATRQWGEPQLRDRRYDIAPAARRSSTPGWS
jgi:hypothetical protein